jgi:hypothetical protein
MQQPVQRPPLALERGEQRVDLLIRRDIAGENRACAEIGSELDDAALEIVVDVGKRQRRAFTLARASPTQSSGSRARR